MGESLGDSGEGERGGDESQLQLRYFGRVFQGCRSVQGSGI